MTSIIAALMIVLAALLGGCATEQRRVKQHRTDITPQQIPVFIRAYRHDPQPDRIADFIVALDNNLTFMVASRHRVSVEGFLYLVVRNNPDRIDAWWDLVRDLRFITRVGFIRVLWMADVPQADAILAVVAKRDIDHLGRQAAQYLDRPRPDLMTASIVEPYDIFLLWGAFYATGEIAYARRVVAELPRQSSHGTARQVAVWRAAIETLTVEGGDPAVAAVLERAVAESPPPDSSAAADVLRAARAVRPLPETLFGTPTAEWLDHARTSDR